MGLGQIASALNLDLAQVRRMLCHLVADGWVAQAGSKSPYTFGARMFSLCGRVLGDLDISRAGQEIMRELRETSGETVHLGVLREGKIICVGRELSRHSVVAVATAIGDSWPLNGSAMGTAARAAMLGADELGADLEAAEASRRGYSVDVGKHKSGIIGLAAAICDYRSEPVGTIAVSGPENRLGQRRQAEVGPLVVAAARRLSAELGHPGPDNGAGR